MVKVATTIGTGTLAVPAFTTVAGPAQMSTVETWMFRADDGDPAGPALFGANGNPGAIFATRLTSPLDAGTWSSLTWTTIVASDVTDMWHVYHNKLHWIAYNTKAAKSLMLMILDKAFAVVLSPTEIIGPSGTGLPVGDYIMNDEFLVGLMGTGAAPGGKVGIGVWNRAGAVTTIFTVSKTGALVDTSVLEAAIGNGSSADQVIEATTLRGRLTNRVFASSTLDCQEEGTVTQFDFDRSWGPAPFSSTLLLSAAGTNYSMATMQPLGPMGQQLLTYRKVTPLYTAPNIDEGNICRQWFGSFIGTMGEQVLHGDMMAARPHTAVWSDPTSGKSYLMTCWSQKVPQVRQYLQVDEIVE